MSKNPIQKDSMINSMKIDPSEETYLQTNLFFNDEFVIRRPQPSNNYEERSPRDDRNQGDNRNSDPIDSNFEQIVNTFWKTIYPMESSTTMRDDMPCPTTPPSTSPRSKFAWKCKECNRILIQDNPKRLCGGHRCLYGYNKGEHEMNDSF